MAATLNFPNQSRSFDATRRRVRFWGYDSALEISFFVDADALMPAGAEAEVPEAELLQAFDQGRERILEVAARVYSRGRGYAYVLTAADF